LAGGGAAAVAPSARGGACRLTHWCATPAGHAARLAALLVLLTTGCLVESVCYDDADCGSGQLCDTRQGRCVPRTPQCDRREDCGPGLACEGGRCVPDSSANATCPEGMISLGAGRCMDAYEASRPDASASTTGQDTSRAVSRAGVLPWHENPVRATTLARFAAACQRAGKHLCTRDEWHGACAGSTDRPYAYGPVFDREACNCVDTFCDDHCQTQGLADCFLGADCGYRYECFRLAPTGSFLRCRNELGIYDLNGNVWEIVPSDRDYRGYEVRGGAFNCAAAATRLTCTYNARWQELYAGFRCCWGPEDALLR